MTVDVDQNSGFCAGVIRAINMAEDFLSSPEGRATGRLYSLGAIVHNEKELSRLERIGLTPIDKNELTEIHPVRGEKLLIRAHGEPPHTYTVAKSLGFELIDCTCPVVLKLQKDISNAYARQHSANREGQIIIFGKIGHAEVLGLLGQVDSDALVIENWEMLEAAINDGSIDLRRPIEIFSQTTKSPAEYAAICTRLEEHICRINKMSAQQFKSCEMLIIHNTICSQVATRHIKLSKFALEHDVIIFVSGKASSNGKVLYDLCKSLNVRTHHISAEEDLKSEWFMDDDRVGVCGATSTPKWLLEKIAEKILPI